MPSIPEQIGHYHVRHEIGRGGMGVVHLARDARLERDVAIKALPDELADEPGRLERFEREARTLAQLNHPNIAQIYGVEEHAGRRYLVLEYVEGETLADRLERGALPVEEAIEIAIEIARGLEAAHAAGVIHRDLKPANVKIAPGGRVKVLDFGLAKAIADASDAGGTSESPTLTLPSPGRSPTMAGAILGTAAYMSPEQARGRPVDRRTDIWSFGVLLYEMLAGASPFRGETATDSIGAVLHKDPAPDALPASTPPALRSLLRKLLAKDRARRLHDIADARLELEDALASPAAAPSAPAPRAPTHRRLGYAACLVAGAALAIVPMRLVLPSSAPAPAVVKLEMPIGDSVLASRPCISPDGRWVVYADEEGLWLRGMDRTEARLLSGTEGAAHPFWAPDSVRLAFMSGRRLLRTSRHGGTSLICETDRAATDVAGGAWHADDTIVFTWGRDAMHRVPASGGAAQTLFTIDPSLEEDFHEASALPDDRGTLFVVHRLQQGGDTIALYANGERTILLQEPGDLLYHPTYAPSGHILFTRTRRTPGVWAVPFSLERLEVTGAPFMVAERGSNPSVANDGTLVYATGVDLDANRLVWLTRDGTLLGAIGEPRTFVASPRISPDGRSIAFGAMDGVRRDVWLQDLERGGRTRVTFGENDSVYGIWSPDGRRLAIAAGWTIVRSWSMHEIDGRNDPRAFGPGRPRCFTSDGALVLGDVAGEDGDDICIWNEAGETTMFLRTPSNESEPSLSPDDAFVAYVSDESGRSEVYLTRFPSGTGRWQISTNGGESPRWSVDGSEILYVQNETLMSVPISTESEVVVGAPTPLFDGAPSGVLLDLGYDVVADGTRFAAVQVRSGAGAGRTGLVVVQNWFEEFRAR